MDRPIDDGLPQPPTTEEVVGAGVMITLAAGTLFAVCAAMGWVLKKVVSSSLDRAWDRDYWTE